LNRDRTPAVMLRVYAREVFIPLAVSFAEKAGLGFGLNKEEALRLTLAVEEVFTYLCRTAAPDRTVEIHCSSGGYYVSLDIALPTDDFNLRAFNLTTPVSLHDDAGLEEMGLVLASRFVDGFRIGRNKGHGLVLTLIIEKSYPVLEAKPPILVQPLAKFSVKRPDPEELKLVVHLIHQHYRDQILPNFCNYPGKLVDMVTGGEYQTAVAVGPTGAIGGAILWHRVGEKTVECFGPYVFGQRRGLGIREELLATCINAIARTHTVGLLNRFPPHDFPQQHFELLGTLSIYSQSGTAQLCNAWFRLMQEDPGCAVWAHPDVQEFLQSQYRRLVLPREIRQTKNEGEQQSFYSVISAEFDRLQGQVMLHPVWPGLDMSDNVARHVELLQHEGIPNVFFVMDLSQAWQGAFTAALLANGFGPRLVLPYAGEGDLLLFQLEGPLS
jgi:anti-sigma regulatory factor (Ser/Thr protein kinase)